MSKSAVFLEHWTDIDAERMTRYETMYQWSAAAATFYRAADIGHGLVVTDFGCGPGHTTVEFARRIGNDGHVHASDINSEFIERTRQRACQQGLPIASPHIYWKPSAFRCRMRAGRVTARNTVVYVRDPVATFTEFRRVLKTVSHTQSRASGVSRSLILELVGVATGCVGAST